jgi:hypothetical protein
MPQGLTTIAEQHIPPTMTRTMIWLERRTDIPPEYFAVGQGMVYHKFMELRRREKWRSNPGDTNFRAAEISWKRFIDAYHAEFPEQQRLPEYDFNALRKKSIEIERNMPIYLSFWSQLEDEGYEVYINKEGQDCVVKDKVKYWKAQDLREEIASTPASRKGKVDICKRCNMRKSHGSGHGTKVCLDGVLISADKDLIRFYQPSELFISKEGYLNVERFHWLVAHSANNPVNDIETHNFAVLANHIRLVDGSFNQLRLAALKIQIATPEILDKHRVWKSNQQQRNDREQKRARSDVI